MTHRFLSWMRAGVGAVAGRTVGALGGELALRYAIDGVAAPPVTLHLHGPADCASIGAAAIARREPTPNATDVSTASFVTLEFAAADLPWRLTPGVARDGALPPWLALVVVPASTPFARTDPRTLPVLTVDAAELPPIASIASWAHVQVEWDDGPRLTLEAYLRAFPERARSRLVAARRLEPRVRYRACLVPTYEAGRRAGLGESIAEAGTGLAWRDGATAIRLPVYDAWEFETSDTVSFETLAKDLRPAAAADWATPQALDVSMVGGGTPAQRYGFLRPVGARGASPDAAQIAARLEAAMSPAATGAVVGPPRYGAITTGHEPVGDEAPLPTPRPSWSDELNHDPWLRLCAGAGARVVRRDQDAIVDEVQRQLGDAVRASDLRRNGELAGLLAERLRDRHVATRPPERAIEAFARGLATPPPLLDATAPAWRRMRRALGPIARGRTTVGAAIARIGQDLDAEPPTPRVGGLATFRLVEVAVRATRPHVPRPPRPPRPRPIRPRPGFDPVGDWPDDGTDGDPAQPEVPEPMTPQEVAAIRAALAARAARQPPLYAPVRTVRLDLAAIAQPLFARDVATAIRGVTEGQVVVAIDGRPGAAGPALASTLPLIEAIAGGDRALFLPGCDAVPPSTVSLLELDPTAVAAAIVGANHELARELAWRRLPFDARATMIRAMWRGGTGAVPAIATWTGALGASLPPCATVLVIRSEVVRRFPDALYAIAAAVADPKRRRRPGPSLRLPVFRFTLAPDLACVGFAAPLPELRRDLGSYLIVQEAVGAARFGLDDAASDGPPAWNNLPWSAVTADPYVRLDVAPRGTWPTAPPWGASGAAMAAITERPAVRLAIHLDELVP